MRTPRGVAGRALAEAGRQTRPPPAAAADGSEAGEADRQHRPSRQFRRGGQAEISTLLNRVIGAADGFPERIIAGRIFPEVPIPARILEP